jgi:hypothetical protein
LSLLILSFSIKVANSLLSSEGVEVGRETLPEGKISQDDKRDKTPSRRKNFIKIIFFFPKYTAILKSKKNTEEKLRYL